MIDASFERGEYNKQIGLHMRASGFYLSPRSFNFRRQPVEHAGVALFYWGIQ